MTDGQTLQKLRSLRARMGPNFLLNNFNYLSDFQIITTSTATARIAAFGKPCRDECNMNGTFNPGSEAFV